MSGVHVVQLAAPGQSRRRTALRKSCPATCRKRAIEVRTTAGYRRHHRTNRFAKSPSTLEAAAPPQQRSGRKLHRSDHESARLKRNEVEEVAAIPQLRFAVVIERRRVPHAAWKQPACHPSKMQAFDLGKTIHSRAAGPERATGTRYFIATCAEILPSRTCAR